MMPRAIDRRGGRAKLVALASVLQVGESLFPHPVPGIRLGLANIITLIVLVRHGVSASVSVAALRTLVSALVLGTFLSPAFLLSFVGALASTLVMAVFYLLSVRSRLPLFSCFGVSVAGSAAHLSAQLAVVGMLARTSAFLWLWPYCALAAVVAGLLTGWVARGAMGRIERLEKSGSAGQTGQGTGCDPEVPVELDKQAAPGQAQSTGRPRLLDRVPAEIRITVALVVCLVIVLSNQIQLYLPVALGLAVVLLVSRVPLESLWRGLVRSVPMLVMLGLIPILFTHWGRRLFSLGPVTVTETGLGEGGRLILRLGMLYFTATVLVLTTPAAAIASGLSQLVRRFRPGRFEPAGEKSDPDGCQLRDGSHPGLLGSAIMALNEYPFVWQDTLRVLRRKRLAGFVNLPAEVIAELITDAEGRRQSVERGGECAGG